MSVTLGFNFKGVLESLTVHLKFLITTSFWGGGSTEGGARLCSLVTDGRTHRSGTELHQGRLRLDMRKNFFTVTVVKHTKRLPNKVFDV